MIDIKKIASGSSGNCIVVGNGKCQIMLDCGLSYNGIRQHVKPSDMEAVFITHEHKDHFGCAKELLRRGIEVYATQGTWEAAGGDYYLPFLVPFTAMDVGGKQGLKVMPFTVTHDAADPVGFLISDRGSLDKAVYIVDSGVINYNFPAVTHWMVEANHSIPGLHGSDLHPKVKARIERNHMSIENLEKLFRTSDVRYCKEIHLLHMSNTRSCGPEFVDRIQKLTGAPVYT